MSINSEHIRLVHSRYQIDEPGNVNSFLSEHEFLAEILLAGADAGEKFFPSCSFKLEVFFDPESNSPSLTASFVTDMPGEDAADAMSKFDDEWWVSAYSTAQGHLLFMVCFE